MPKCTLCPKVFSTQGRLTPHISTHTKEKPYKCLTCSVTFGNLSNFRRHTNVVHNSDLKTINCPVCAYKCNDGTKLKKHLRIHSAQILLSCSVPSCSFKTNTPKGLREHVRRVHVRETPYECKSVGCNYKTSEVGNLYRHLKVHSNERPFACKVPGCNYTGKTKPYLTTHIQIVHSDQRPWKCSKCSFRAKHKSNLLKHQANHGRMKRFECQARNCYYSSNDKMSVVMHFDRKHRKKDIVCTQPRCQYRCGSATLLKLHLKKHQLPILKCPATSCNFSAILKTGLRAHISSCHGDQQFPSLSVSRKPDPSSTAPTTSVVDSSQCPCPNCDYQTAFPHRYERHVMSHGKQEERKYVCTFCSIRFSNVTQYRGHIQRHIQEKPHNCSQCDYTAVDGASLRVHARRHHRIFVIPHGKENQFERQCQRCSFTSSSYTELALHSMAHLKPVVVLERLRVHVM